MHLVVKTVNGWVILKDKSPDGIPRFVCKKNESVVLFNRVYYNLDKVEKICQQR